MIQKIEHKHSILAIILTANHYADNIEFFTPDDFSQQLCYMNRPQGYVIPPHIHNPVSREVQFTKEVFLIKSSKVRVDVDQNYLESRILRQGAQRPSVRVKRLEGEGLRVTRIAEPVIYSNENCVDVNYQIFAEEQASGGVEILSESHPMRHFSIPELDLFAQMSGFERVGTEEFLSGNAPSEEALGVCVLLKKG